MQLNVLGRRIDNTRDSVLAPTFAPHPPRRIAAAANAAITSSPFEDMEEGGGTLFLLFNTHFR